MGMGKRSKIATWLLEHAILFSVGFLISMVVPVVYCDSRRPVYNIAHMVNSIKELEDYLDRGANAIELDIAFYRNGSVKNVYHGYPCDCYRICDERAKFSEYLNHVRDIMDPNGRKNPRHLALLLFDLKFEDVSRSHKYSAGEEIAKHLISHLWNKDVAEPRISVLVSIGHTSDSDAIKGIIETLKNSKRGKFLNKIGFDVGLNDDLNSIRRMWSKLQVTHNRWQGDGLTNCLRPFKDDVRLRQAIRHRDASNAFIEKVYDWTVDLTSNIRHSLRLGVDGILTNFPERVHSVLREPEFQDRYRLATTDDDPFSRVNVNHGKSPVRRVELDAYVGSLREIAVSLMGYFWDFYRLRLQNPSTLFPMLQDIIFRSSQTVSQYRSSVVNRPRKKQVNQRRRLG